MISDLAPISQVTPQLVLNYPTKMVLSRNIFGVGHSRSQEKEANQKKCTIVLVYLSRMLLLHCVTLSVMAIAIWYFVYLPFIEFDA